MVPGQSSQFVTFVEPVALTTPWTATSLVVDSINWDYLVIEWSVGTHATIVVSASARHSVANGSAQANITGTVSTTSWTIPAANTSPYHIVMCIDLRMLNRYIDVAFTGAANGILSVNGTLYRGKSMATTLATSGADVLVIA